MITKIHKLQDGLINQIAAGEVVDNPSSVLKELIENAIDALSKNITIQIENGGHKKITVIDDGHGMNKLDLKNSFQRFATSKISSKNDLFNISTLGFRGEALPSIASVSKIKIASKYKKEIGNELILESGKIISEKPSNISKGTKIEINNLFYNVPARKKFLKKENYEYRSILKVFKVFALSNSKISFILYHNNKCIYNIDASDLYTRILDIQGNNYNGNILDVNYKYDNYEVNGFISNLSILKKSRGNQYIFINNRYIYNRLINTTILNAYDSLINRGEYPFFVLNITIPGNLIDVNVHPKKTQVKFQNELQIQHVIKKSIVNKLKDFQGVIPKMYVNTENYENSLLDLPFNNNTLNKREEVETSKVNNMFTKNSTTLFEDVKVWQIHNKYLITEISSGLVIIDQHVAHERILFESAKLSLDGEGIDSQKIIFPITLKYEPEEYQRLIEIIPYLTKIGFDIRQFGTSSIIIEGTPPELSLGKEKEVINDILDNYVENKQLNSSFIDYIAATYACKAAIKAGDKLEDSECVSLINKLFSTTHPYYCPHGRPIIINVTISDLDKRFERH